MVTNTAKNTELQMALRACKEYFVYAGLFSAAVNILLLTPIIYMLTVYDRVVTSGSLSTLAMLTILMVCLLLAVGGFEWVRSMILVSGSNQLEKMLRNRISDASFRRSLLNGMVVVLLLGDLTSLRQFLTGNGLLLLRRTLVPDLCRCDVYVSPLVWDCRNHQRDRHGRPRLRKRSIHKYFDERSQR